MSVGLIGFVLVAVGLWGSSRATGQTKSFFVGVFCGLGAILCVVELALMIGCR